jgi:glucose uptake protein GlcU
MIVTILLWSLRYLYHYFVSGRDAMKAWNAIPSFHIREMWLQGLLSGLLYSLGNVCSILAISSLGQGVGFSFIQSSMLISGLWGVCFFREIRGLDRIMKWLLSSIATIIGILLLSHQHIGNLVHR